MKQQTKPIEDLVKALPVDMQDEVRDFVEFLLEKHAPRRKTKPKLDWRGALRDLRGQYTAVELQHEALEWWAD